MKPRPIFRTVIIFIAASVSVFFLESERKANKVCNKPVEDLSSTKANFITSNNNFIFFESLSKYLSISF